MEGPRDEYFLTDYKPPGFGHFKIPTEPRPVAIASSSWQNATHKLAAMQHLTAVEMHDHERAKSMALNVGGGINGLKVGQQSTEMAHVRAHHWAGIVHAAKVQVAPAPVINENVHFEPHHYTGKQAVTSDNDAAGDDCVEVVTQAYKSPHHEKQDNGHDGFTDMHQLEAGAWSPLTPHERHTGTGTATKPPTQDVRPHHHRHPHRHHHHHHAKNTASKPDANNVMSPRYFDKHFGESSTCCGGCICVQRDLESGELICCNGCFTRYLAKAWIWEERRCGRWPKIFMALACISLFVVFVVMIFSAQDIMFGDDED